MAVLRELKVFITTAGSFEPRKSLFDKIKGAVDKVAPTNMNVLIAKGSEEFATTFAKSILDPSPVREVPPVFIKALKNADTDRSPKLVYTTRSGRREELFFPALAHNQWEKERTDSYTFSVDSDDDLQAVRPEQFRLVAQGRDAWLPASIFILGRSKGRFRVLVARDNWPIEAWFSADVSDVGGFAEKARLLDPDGTPTSS